MQIPLGVMPPRPTPPADVRDWPSYRYWRENNDQIKQYWYVSFCLMMSSVQDRLTGLALRETGNLNWATTAFYYSAVHAGRLLCFVCTGDYPTGHAQLAQLLAPDRERPENRTRRQFHFDWLDRFQRYLGGAAPRTSAEQSRADRDAILGAINVGLPQVRPKVDRFGPLLAAFRNLRNDCNYESLLVAHEKRHFLVTEGFDLLVGAADEASAVAMDMATALYIENLKTEQCFETERDLFVAAHHLYLKDRFERSLHDKFQHSQVAMTGLQHATEGLAVQDGAEESASAHAVEEFLNPIMYGQFGQKQGLMDRWKRDVEALKYIVTPQSPES